MHGRSGAPSHKEEEEEEKQIWNIFSNYQGNVNL
jgi:hypothetical protein